MADDQLSLKFAIDSKEAVTGLVDVDGALKKVAEDVEKVKAPADAAKSALAELGAAGLKVEEAERKIAAQGDSPRGLMRAAAAAQLSVQKLKDELVAAGKPIPPAVEASLKRVETAAAGAAKRAGEMREQMDLTKRQGMAAAQGAEAMTGAFGSLEGVMRQLKSSTSESSRAMAEFGLKGAAVFAAFSFGYDMGKKLIETFKEFGIHLDTLGNKLIDTRGLLDPLPGKVNEVMKAHQAAAKAIQETAAELKKLGVEWKDAGQEALKLADKARLVGIAIAESAKKGEGQADVAKANTAALLALRDEYERNGVALDKIDPKLRSMIQLADGMKKAQERNAEAAKTLRLANEELNPAIVKILSSLEQEILHTGKVAAAEEKAMAALAEWAKEHGLAVTDIQAVVTAQTALLNATKVTAEEGIDRQRAALVKLGGGLREAAAATTNYTAVYKTAIEQLTKASDRWDKETEAIEKNKAALEAATDARKQQLATMEIIHTELMKATNEQVEALEREIDSFRRLHEEMGAGADRLEDYAGTMKAAFESGMMTLQAWLSQIDIAITQMEVLAMKNPMTKFAQDTMKMVAALKELRQAVVSGNIKPAEKINW